MKLTSAQIELTLDQYEAKALPESHPLVARLSELFGDHTFFLDGNGLNVVEPTTAPAREGSEAMRVINLANWTDEKYKVRVAIEADPRADAARKDVRTLLFESVRELLFNAVKHAHAARATLELALDADDRLCITVTDQGIGFDPAALDDRSKAGQVGWGLFSIRERLTLLGGRFDVDSAPGRGTRVRLVAPRGEDAVVSSIAPIQPASAGDDGRASPDSLRILIVDDHAAVRDALRDILHERPQFSVVGDASNGIEAIAHAHTLRPDVILMDIVMPQMDGVEATARIRAELPEIEILALSMQPRSAAAEAIEQAGAGGVFVKGIDTQRLIDHLLAVPTRRGAPAILPMVMPARPRVMLADDHPGMVAALDRVLSLECDIVGVVADGGEVAAAAARLQPVVIVVDLNLPNLSGLEACRRVMQADPRAKVILISGVIDETIRAEALAAGASDVVSKLAAGKDLLVAIARAWAALS